MNRAILSKPEVTREQCEALLQECAEMDRDAPPVGASVVVVMFGVVAALVCLACVAWVAAG